LTHTITIFLTPGHERMDDQKSNRGGIFIVGYKNELYYIGSDFQVGMLKEPFMSVGCGEEIAEGALYALAHSAARGEMPVKSQVLIALKAAAEYSAGVRCPFKILSLGY